MDCGQRKEGGDRQFWNELQVFGEIPKFIYFFIEILFIYFQLHSRIHLLITLT